MSILQLARKLNLKHIRYTITLVVDLKFMNSILRIDFAAITLSVLCLLHCLALPVLAATLPVLGAVGEAEWIHKLLVLFALPISGFAIYQTSEGAGRQIFAGMVFVGALFLVCGAFVEALHDYEVVLSTCGACFIVLGHLYRWFRVSQ